MEIRAILANLFRRFSFELTPTYANHDPVATGVPFESFGGTMGLVLVLPCMVWLGGWVAGCLGAWVPG